MINGVYPTKGNLLSSKKTLGLAKVGFDLLDKKRYILIHELLETIEKADEVRKNIDQTYKDAYYALQRANITLGVVDATASTIPLYSECSIYHKSVMGVELPVVKYNAQKQDIMYSPAMSNSALDKAFTLFQKAKAETAEFAAIENSVYRLAIAIKTTQKRANALRNIVIPRYEKIIKYIYGALEEKDREDFSRLKVIKRQKEQNNTLKNL